MSYYSDDWYVRDAGSVAGPFTREEVMERLGRGELDWYHEVSQRRFGKLSGLGRLNPVFL